MQQVGAADPVGYHVSPPSRSNKRGQGSKEPLVSASLLPLDMRNAWEAVGPPACPASQCTQPLPRCLHIFLAWKTLRGRGLLTLAARHTMNN